MLKESIFKSLTKFFDFELTESQKRSLDTITAFLADNNPESALILKGFAGTGKTTLISGLIHVLQNLKTKSVLLAPTGRAAKVLSGYTSKPAYTIHKKIYRQKSANDGMGEFALDRNLHKNTFFIVDEASMLTDQSSEKSIFGSGSTLQDLFTYVLNGVNCRLIFVGDTAQLPPVGFNTSPALTPELLRPYCLKVYETELTDVVRQEQASGILANATEIRVNIENQNSSLPTLNTSNYKDIVRLEGQELIETLADNYDKYGLEGTVLITRSNKRANKYNEGIRNSVLWKEAELSQGDLLMVVKNNYFWIKDDEKQMGFIANGDTAEIVRIHGYQEIYNCRFADVTLRFRDYIDLELDVKIMLDTLSSNTASLSSDENKTLFHTILEDYSEVKGRQKQYKKVLENEYFNALQVKFAYALTCHKAQGGQWKSVFIDQGYLTDEMINLEYLRWLYTSFTRATQKLYLINFSEKIFTFK